MITNGCSELNIASSVRKQNTLRFKITLFNTARFSEYKCVNIMLSLCTAVILFCIYVKILYFNLSNLPTFKNYVLVHTNVLLPFSRAKNMVVYCENYKNTYVNCKTRC